MDSFEDILARVLKRKEDATSGVGAAVGSSGRRPLRDPATDAVNLMGDIRAALRSIRSPEVTRALQARVNLPVEQDDSFSRFNRDSGGNANESPSSSAGPRKTTLRDDSRVAGELANAASSMVKQVVTAGGAIADFSKNTGKLDDAVSGMTGSAENASKAMKPTEGFRSWVRSMLEFRKSSQDVGQQTGSPSSPAEKGGHTGVTDRISGFLNSSSLADGVRGLVGRLQAGSGGGGGMRPPNDDDGSFRSRVGNAVDSSLHRSMNVFRGMSGRGQSTISQRIGRAGRRLLAGNFKNRVQRGGQISRWAAGNAGGGGANLPPSSAVRSMFGPMGSPGSIPGMAMMGGGGGAAAGGGAGAAAGAAGAGGAAAGLGAATIATGGLILAFLALVAIVHTAAKTLYQLGVQGYETSLRLAQYDGALSAAKAQLEVNRLMRDIQSAGRLSDSGSRLIQKFDQLEAALRPFTDGALVVGMEFLIVTIDLLTEAFKALIKVLLFDLKLLAMVTPDNGVDNAIVAALDAAFRNAMNPAAPVNVNQGGMFDQFAGRPILPPRPPLPPLNGPVGGIP